MFTKRNFIVVFCFFVQLHYAQGQTKAEQLFFKLTEHYTKTNKYALDMTYEMYKLNEKGIEFLAENYKVSLVKDGAITKVNAIEAEMYTYQDYIISVFEDGKEIVVRKNIAGSTINGINQLADFSTDYTISIISEKENTVVLELKPKQTKKDKAAYTSIEILANKNTYEIFSQKLSLKQKVPYKTEDGLMLQTQGILKIVFKNKKGGTPTLPTTSAYFITKNKNGTLLPAAAFKDYLITDRRNNSERN